MVRTILGSPYPPTVPTTPNRGSFGFSTSPVGGGDYSKSPNRDSLFESVRRRTSQAGGTRALRRASPVPVPWSQYSTPPRKSTNGALPHLTAVDDVTPSSTNATLGSPALIEGILLPSPNAHSIAEGDSGYDAEQDSGYDCSKSFRAVQWHILMPFVAETFFAIAVQPSPGHRAEGE